MPPLVLLHGQPGGGSDWRAVVDLLPAEIDATVIDRPGYRSNPRPASDFQSNARALFADLDAAGESSAVLVGHSYGGGVALAAAALAPERVRGLVLVASVGPGCLSRWDMLLAAPIAGEVCAWSAWWLTPWIARARLARITRQRNRPIEHDEYVNWEVWASAHHEHGAVWQTFLIEQRALVRGLDELMAGLGDITCPTLVLADPADSMIPVATTYALAAAIPGAQLQLAERGGHHLPRRNPAVVAQAITTFMAALPA